MDAITKDKHCEQHKDQPDDESDEWKQILLSEAEDACICGVVALAGDPKRAANRMVGVTPLYTADQRSAIAGTGARLHPELLT